MNTNEAYQHGYDAGRASALYCMVNHEARREAAYHSGCQCKAPKVCHECLTRAAYEAEMGARSFTPWEQIASNINKTKSHTRRDNLWASYDEGVQKGIHAGVNMRLRT
jgi:hypothetical protein